VPWKLVGRRPDFPRLWHAAEGKASAQALDDRSVRSSRGRAEGSRGRRRSRPVPNQTRAGLPLVGRREGADAVPKGLVGHLNQVVLVESGAPTTRRPVR